LDGFDAVNLKNEDVLFSNEVKGMNPIPSPLHASHDPDMVQLLSNCIKVKEVGQRKEEVSEVR
jgi:hypothetical protein